MNQIVQSLATMVGMIPSNGGKDHSLTLAQIHGWVKGLVFGLAAVAAVWSIITGSIWFAQVIVPRLLGA